MQTSQIQIPPSIQREHHEIHTALEAATLLSGRTGAAARALANVLHPHFVREEEIALPPLGLLAPLLAGTRLPESVVTEALAMTDSLREELPRMLREHEAIHAAVESLQKAAHDERALEAEQLAHTLAAHARTEEEVLYPAAVLVGDLLRARGVAARR